MSSYYPSFSYKGFNSLKDKNLIVVAFDPDQGEMDTFLGMEPIYTDKYDGSKRLDYGAKFNSVAVIKISVIKRNKKDFTVAEVRDFLKWTTGARTNSYLDLMVGDEVKFSFLGRVTNAYQQKLDARTIGLSIEFTSVSPWAYSPIQYAGYASNQTIEIDNAGVVYKSGTATSFNIDEKEILYDSSVFSIANDGVISLNDSKIVQIDNKTDDLYTPVYLNTVFKNGTSSTLLITNRALNEETKITSLAQNEVITLSAEQFILSDKYAKIFGDDFNYVWPRLAPGLNDLLIDIDGSGSIEFTYRYPIKIGNCAIDIDALNNTCGDYYEDNFENNTSTGGSTSSGGSSNSGGIVSGVVSWNNIINTPTTIGGYGITNAYTKAQIEDIVAGVECTINDKDLNDMLSDILG